MALHLTILQYIIIHLRLQLQTLQSPTTLLSIIIIIISFLIASYIKIIPMTHKLCADEDFFLRILTTRSELAADLQCLGHLFCKQR